MITFPKSTRRNFQDVQKPHHHHGCCERPIPVAPYAFFESFPITDFDKRMICLPKPHWSTGSQLVFFLDNFLFPLCGAYKAMQDKPGLLVLLIGIYPHLQAIGLECPLWVYPTPEEGDPRSKLSKSRHKKKCSCRLCRTHGPQETISIKFIVQKGIFFFGKKIDRFWADIANPDIPRFTYFLILSQCLEKCCKDWKLALKEDRLVKSRILGTSLKFKEPRY